MSAAPTTKLQINLKTPRGALINIYADSGDELDQGLEEIAGRVQAILDVEALLSAGSVVVSAAPSNVTQLPTPAANAAVPAVSCPHGNTIFRTSKPGAAKKWQGYFCPLAKGAPGQCSPQWIDQAEWIEAGWQQ